MKLQNQTTYKNTTNENIWCSKAVLRTKYNIILEQKMRNNNTVIGQVIEYCKQIKAVNMKTWTKVSNS